MGNGKSIIASTTPNSVLQADIYRVGPPADDRGRNREAHEHIRDAGSPERKRESPRTSPEAAESFDPGDLVAGGGPDASAVVFLVVGGLAVPEPGVLPQEAQAPRAPLLRLRRGYLRLLGPPVARQRVRGASPSRPALIRVGEF